MIANITVTDTFGGEANFCWVKRRPIANGDKLSRRTLIARAKELAGWTGWCRVRVEDVGDGYIIRPTASSGVCQIAFIEFSENE